MPAGATGSFAKSIALSGASVQTSSARGDTKPKQSSVASTTRSALASFEQIEPLGVPEPRRTDTQSAQRAKYPDHHPDDDDEMPF
jgi:hypothetical protein